MKIWPDWFKSYQTAFSFQETRQLRSQQPDRQARVHRPLQETDADAHQRSHAGQTLPRILPDFSRKSGNRTRNRRNRFQLTEEVISSSGWKQQSQSRSDGCQSNVVGVKLNLIVLKRVNHWELSCLVYLIVTFFVFSWYTSSVFSTWDEDYWRKDKDILYIL